MKLQEPRNRSGRPWIKLATWMGCLAGSLGLSSPTAGLPSASAQVIPGMSIPALVRLPSKSAGPRHSNETGLLLTGSTRHSIVLGRDGAMHRLGRAETAALKPVEGSFTPLSAVELRQRLQREYGSGFEVVATSHFLVVQPVGRGKRWAELFEASHRGFVDFMTQRNVRVRKGKFPMVAVVMPDRNAMRMEMKRHDIQMKNVAGVYSGGVNRVITHDDAARSSASATVRHEAAHQSAYNSGVHSRVCETPKWITEGIGQMFEPSGMTNHRSGASVADQINRYSLRKLQSKLDRPDELTGIVSRLIREDSMFQNPREVDDAYDVSWAMMFYLAQRSPDRFAAVLNNTSTRAPFTNYPPADRLRDFQTWTGDSPAIFSRKLWRYLRTL